MVSLLKRMGSMARTDLTSDAWTAVNAAQLALALGGFLGEDVALERLSALDAAAEARTMKRFLAPLLVFIFGIEDLPISMTARWPSRLEDT